MIKFFRLQASSEIDSNEWEWDSPSKESCEEKDIDVVQAYAPIIYEGKRLGSWPFEYGSQHIDDDSSEDD